MRAAFDIKTLTLTIEPTSRRDVRLLACLDLVLSPADRLPNPTPWLALTAIGLSLLPPLCDLAFRTLLPA